MSQKSADLPPKKLSPRWSPTTKGFITAILLLLLLGILYFARGLLLPLVVSFVLAYVLEPVVKVIHRNTPLSRTVAIGLVYLLIIAALVAIPATTIPPLVEQVGNFFSNLPRAIVAVNDYLNSPIQILDFTFTPLEQLPLDALTNNLITLVQTTGTQSLALVTRFSVATLQTLGWIAFVLFVSFYAVKDEGDIYDAIVRIFPEPFQDDARQLGTEINVVWNAFLRGQVFLSLTIFLVVFVVAWIIGLPNPLVLGLLAGVLEVVPYLGPVLSAVPGVMLAFFQPGASWLGSLIGPWWFALVVAFLYWLVQQVEAYWLVPRIMGRQLKMHPLVVFVAALVGASVAGILGIFLASPVLATARIIGRYTYCKLIDTDPFPTIDAIAPLTNPPVSNPSEDGTESPDSGLATAAPVTSTSTTASQDAT